MPIFAERPAAAAPVILAMSALAMVSAGGAEPGQDSAKTPVSAKPPTPELANLELFVGPWNVVETHYDERGNVLATVKGTEENRWVLDQHVLQRSYTSTGTSAFRALGLVTYNTLEKKYHGVWLDNLSSAGPAVLKGDWEAQTKTLICNLESFAQDGKPVRHKIVERFVDPDTRVATTFLVRGQEVTKKLEVRYTRSAPCPSSIRILFDD